MLAGQPLYSIYFVLAYGSVQVVLLSMTLLRSGALDLAHEEMCFIISIRLCLNLQISTTAMMLVSKRLINRSSNSAPLISQLPLMWIKSSSTQISLQLLRNVRLTNSSTTTNNWVCTSIGCWSISISSGSTIVIVNGHGSLNRVHMGWVISAVLGGQFG